MERKTVVVTGIGGNVGQGIIRNLKHTGYDLYIVGTNIAPFSSGNYLVDAAEKVPFGYDPHYVETMLRVAERHQADLIIPSTDYEVFYLADAASRFSCKIASSGPTAAGIYLDKFLSWQHHHANNIPFAKSVLPSEWKGQFSKAIAKPRKGRGSRGLLKLYFDARQLNDDEYMVQDMHIGTEITTAVYVSYITGQVKGLITMERKLENGTTTYTKVNQQYDEQLLEMARKMVEVADLKGSFNIQSIVNEQGEIVPFEINCRISGTNSIRTHFGFADTAYTAMELLYEQEAPVPQVKPGIAYRTLVDIIYPNVATESELKQTSGDNFIIY